MLVDAYKMDVDFESTHEHVIVNNLKTMLSSHCFAFKRTQLQILHGAYSILERPLHCLIGGVVFAWHSG